jgi:hypothetical protein
MKTLRSFVSLTLFFLLFLNLTFPFTSNYAVATQQELSLNQSQRISCAGRI